MSTEYGKRLRAARKLAGLTQVELSKRTGIPQSTISTAERLGHGSAETPIYAKVCGVDAHWLATGDGQMLDKNIPVTNTGASNIEAVEVTRGGSIDLMGEGRDLGRCVRSVSAW